MPAAQRNTWQREAVRDALEARASFVSAQQLHADLQRSGSTIGLATVYRALASLVESTEADCLQSPEGEQLYRSCNSDAHHHHLICRGCGCTIEIAADEIERWTSTIASRHGFADVTHVIDLFGTCESCTSSAE